MAGGNSILTDLIFNIATNTGELKKGLSDANKHLKGFSEGVNKIKSVIASAFAVTAIIGAAKAVFEFAKGIDDTISKIDDLGISFTNLDAGRLKAITETFGVDMDRVLSAANASSKQFGISFSDALTKVQQGLALAGPQSEKYLKSLEAGAAGYASLGKSADDYFTVITNGYRSSTDWEKDIQLGLNTTKKSFADLNSEMNEGQTIQQRLINSQAEFYSLAAKTFDGTGDLVDKLKANLFELGVKTFKVVKSSIVDTINYFIDLYNESTTFRIVVQSIITQFKILWDVVKLVADTLINAFKGVGKIITAILKGDFASIGQIIADTFTDVTKSAFDTGKEIATDIVAGANAVLSRDKIKLIDDKDIDEQVSKAVNKISSVTSGGGKKGKDIKFGNADDKINVAANISSKFVAPQIVAVNNLKNAWSGLGDTIQSSIGGTAVDALNMFGESLVNTNEGSKKSFGALVGTMVQGIGKIVKGYIGQAIAAQIADGSKKGLVGLALAGVGIAGVMALAKKIPAFANGGISQGGLSLVGERGAELVNLPSGSRVFNNRDTNSILGASNNLNITVNGMIRGDDIWFVNSEINRKRGNIK